MKGLVSLAVLGVFLSCSEKKSTEPQKPTAGIPTPEAQAEMNLESADIIVSSDDNQNAVNTLEVRTETGIGVKKVFRIAGTSSRQLLLSDLQLDNSECVGSDPVQPRFFLQQRDAQGNVASELPLVSHAAPIFLRADTEYQLLVVLDNTVAQCKTIKFSFKATSKEVPPESIPTVPQPGSNSRPINPTPVAPLPSPTPEPRVTLLSGLQFVGKLSEAEGCQVTYESSIKKILNSETLTDDNIKLIRTQEQGLDYHSLEVRVAVGNFNHSPFRFDGKKQSIDEIERVLKTGSLAPVTIDDSCLSFETRPGQKAISIDNLAVIPRPIADAGTELTQINLEPEETAQSRIKYSYGEDFFWEAALHGKISDERYKAIADKIKFNVFNPDSLAYLSDWMTISKASLRGRAFRLSNETTLRRMLPRQQNVQLVFDVSSETKKEYFIIPLESYCTDLQLKVFRDLTAPGKKCFELKEQDLPPIPTPTPEPTMVPMPVGTPEPVATPAETPEPAASATPDVSPFAP